MKKIVLAYISLAILDAITTFWFTSTHKGIELNPFLYPLSGTLWLFPVMILPQILVVALAIWLLRRVGRIFYILIISGLIAGIFFLLFLVVNNIMLIFYGVSILGG